MNDYVFSHFKVIFVHDQHHTSKHGSFCLIAGAPLNLVVNQGAYRVLNSCKTLEICPAIFQTWKKFGKWRESPEKWWKVLFFFSFQCYKRCFISEFFSFWSTLTQSHPVHLQSTTKTLCSCVFLRSRLSLEKEIIVLEKSLEEVLNFGSKNLYKPQSNLSFFFLFK